MVDVAKIADAADVILNGYAFTRSDLGIRVLNLHATDRAAVLREDGTLIETSMDPLEVRLVTNYMLDVLKYMED